MIKLCNIFDFASKFNNINIRRKLLISYILVVFLPVLLIGVFLIFNMRQTVLDQALREASSNVERINSRLGEILKLTMDISYRIQMDQNLEKLLLKDYKSTEEIFDSYYQYNEINNIINFYSREIRDIRIYANNKSILDTGQFIKITPDILDSEWYKKIRNINGKLYWQYLSTYSGSNRNLCLTKIIMTMSGHKNLGALVISVNGDYLFSLLKDEPYNTYFIDDIGNIITAKDKKMIGVNIRDSEISMVGSFGQGIRDIRFDGKPAKVIVKFMTLSAANGNFKIVSIVPINHIQKQVANTAILGIVIMSASLLLALPLIFLFTNAINKRIKRLSMDMHRVAGGNFEFTPSVDGDDEIGQLSRDLNIMIKSIKELVHKVYETNEQKNQLAIKQREIKFNMLANQINPHFLFNALETIRMKAHCKGEEDIAEIVKLLGKIMRRNLEIGSEMVALDSELDIVKSYLEIQKFRYGDKISYSIEYENEECRNYKIMPLTIQPIVENAVVHGLESKPEPGSVKICLAKINSYLIITIEDDGVGMSEEKLRNVINYLDEAEDLHSKRIGLKNVHQRIKLFYGEEYGLRIFSEKNRGTRIEIILPSKW